MDPENKQPEVTQPETVPPEQPTVITPTVAPEPRKSKLPLAILIIVLLLVAAGAAYFLMRQHTTATHTQSAVKKDIPVLRIGMGEGSGNELYPNSPLLAADFELNYDVFSALVAYKDQTKIAPNLAVSWNNPDNSTWVFNLRQGVKFHSGNPLTSADVKKSIEYIQKNNKDLSEYTQTIKSVDTPNDHTVVIKTDGPDPILLNKLTNIFIYDTAAPAATVDKGSGPYKIKPGTTPSATQVNLVANDNFWGGHIYTRELDYTIGDNPTLNSEFLAGKLDMLADAITTNSSQLAKYPTYNMNDLSVRYLMLNSLDPKLPQSKPDVRTAIEYALDRTAIAKAFGNGTEAKPATQLLPQEIAGYDPSIKAPPHDVSKAKQLLAQAGYPNGFAMTINASALALGPAQEIAKELNAVGIQATAQQLPEANYVDTVLDGTHPAFIIAYGSDFLDGSDFFTFLLQQSGYSKDPQIDDALAKVNQSLNPGARLQALQSVSRLAAKDATVIPLYTREDAIVFHKPVDYHQDQTTNITGLNLWELHQ